MALSEVAVVGGEVVGRDGSGSVFGPAEATAGAVDDMLGAADDVAGLMVLALIDGECVAGAPAAIADTAPSAEASKALLKSV
jgi:malate/lactate dehydrogenase